MNPNYPTGACPPEAVALQGRAPDGVFGQPGYPTTVQYTTVNIPAERPKDYIIWSLCNFFYGNICCLGLAAFTFSIKARDQKVAGDLQGAQHYGSTSRCLNIWATVLNVIIVLVCVIVITAIGVQANTMINYGRGYSHNSYGG